MYCVMSANLGLSAAVSFCKGATCTAAAAAIVGAAVAAAALDELPFDRGTKPSCDGGGADHPINWIRSFVQTCQTWPIYTQCKLNIHVCLVRDMRSGRH
jgi:hypothetical protein